MCEKRELTAADRSEDEHEGERQADERTDRLFEAAVGGVCLCLASVVLGEWGKRRCERTCKASGEGAAEQGEAAEQVQVLLIDQGGQVFEYVCVCAELLFGVSWSNTAESRTFWSIVLDSFMKENA